MSRSVYIDLGCLKWVLDFHCNKSKAVYEGVWEVVSCQGCFI